MNGILICHPEPDTYEQLSRPAQADPDVKLIAGEVGVLDCATTHTLNTDKAVAAKAAP